MKRDAKWRHTIGASLGVAALAAAIGAAKSADGNVEPSLRGNVIEGTIVALPTGSGLTGGPATDPANPIDAKIQGGAAAASMLANAAIGYAAAKAAKADAEKAATEALAHLPPGSIAVVVSQTTNYRNTEDSLLNGSMNRIGEISTGQTPAQAQANQQAGLDISRGASLDRGDVEVTSSTQTMWKSVVDRDGNLAVVAFDPSAYASRVGGKTLQKTPTDDFLDDDDFESPAPNTPLQPTPTQAPAPPFHEHVENGPVHEAPDHVDHAPQAGRPSQAVASPQEHSASPPGSGQVVNLTKDGEGFVHFSASSDKATAAAPAQPARAAAPAKAAPGDAHSGGGHGPMDGAHDVSGGHDPSARDVARTSATG
jgi:hypothetical protein